MGGIRLARSPRAFLEGISPHIHECAGRCVTPSDSLALYHARSVQPFHNEVQHSMLRQRKNNVRFERTSCSCEAVACHIEMMLCASCITRHATRAFRAVVLAAAPPPDPPTIFPYQYNTESGFRSAASHSLCNLPKQRNYCDSHCLRLSHRSSLMFSRAPQWRVMSARLQLPLVVKHRALEHPARKRKFRSNDLTGSPAPQHYNIGLNGS